MFSLRGARASIASYLVVVALGVGSRAAPAQAQPLPPNVPTPAQAQDLLARRPELLAQLRQRILASGLTREQLSARLRAAGYPETLLEQVLGTAPATTPLASSDSLVRAVRALGIVPADDSLLLDGMSPFASATRGDSVSRERARRDSVTGVMYLPDGRTFFGYALFAGGTTLFDPNAAGPVDPSYRLGPGDQLVLLLAGDVEAAHTLDVTREGFVVVPNVGTVPVANLTMGQVEQLLHARLARVHAGLGRTTHLTLSVARLRSHQVFVAGDVRQPGSYRVAASGTALSALYAAGGPTERGTLRRVEIRRRGEPVRVLDVYAYLVRGDASGDVRLQQGDVIFVPPHGDRVRLGGGVLRPATYEVRDGESLRDVVQAAGGFADDASVRHLRIERIVPPHERSAEGSDRIVLDVPLATTDRLATVRVVAGDVIDVPRVAARVRQRITVNGNVWQEGAQGWTAGTTLSDALQRAGGLKPDALLSRVLVSRLRPDSTRVQLAARVDDVNGRMTVPLLLQEDDEITVFALTTFRAERHVALTGAVRKPGRYAWREGMTMRDLVLLAGGLLPSALLTEAEIARLPASPREGQLATTFRAPLDSTYLVEAPAVAAQAPDVILQPYDNVLVLQQPDWQVPWAVSLTGEVRFPGVYSLTSKSERLSDVIARAGGLTTAAYPAGVEFTRGAERARVGIELDRVLRDARHRDNLLLQHGDSVFIPRYNALVVVSGAVNSPMAVPYEPGKSLDHYVRAAGGAKREADAKRAYVQQSNGKVVTRTRTLRLFASTPVPSPGSRVVVPARDAADKRDITQLLGTVAQVLGSLVTVLVVVSRTK